MERVAKERVMYKSTYGEIEIRQNQRVHSRRYFPTPNEKKDNDGHSYVYGSWILGLLIRRGIPVSKSDAQSVSVRSMKGKPSHRAEHEGKTKQPISAPCVHLGAAPVRARFAGRSSPARSELAFAPFCERAQVF